MFEPFLRWAGGKRWLASKLSPLLSSRLNDRTYYEPFLGAGSMFFAVAPQRAILSDTNADLINAFRRVADSPAAIRAHLKRLPNSKSEFLRVRSSRPRSLFGRAVRFIYLNRNCWGGLYRENKDGAFNVPYGGPTRNHKALIQGSILEDASKLICCEQVKLCVIDFEVMISRAVSGDVVYCDPTYRKRTRQHFDRYGAKVFAWSDQERLALAAAEAAKKGVLVVVSNASCFGVSKLYPQALVLEVQRKKGIGATTSSAQLKEYLFILDPQERWSEWICLGKVIQRPLGSRIKSTSSNRAVAR